LERACELVSAGEAVVVPNPPPLTYGVVAKSAPTVNVVKGRAPDQNVAVSPHVPSQRRHLRPMIDLPAAALGSAAFLLSRRLTVLLPVRPGVPVPTWVAPAVRDQQLAAFNGWWTPTATVWRRFPRLYGSSANRTGGTAATTAAEAQAALGRDCLVLDGNALANPGQWRAPSTMAPLDQHGRLSLYRSGAQERRSPPAAFLRQVADLVGLPLTPDGEEDA
jgi:tRNA A37 threonylcarbamoyladenosine synthetase subunit TsaC/SUA5/YrdC